MGIVFPEGGQLAHEFCMANALYRKHPGTGEPMGGYLEENRRVRALKLRGVESDGLWLPIKSVEDWLVHLKAKSGHGPRTGVPIFNEGDRLTDVKGHRLCGKYYTPATLRAMRSKNPVARRLSCEAAALQRHYDTPQLRSAHLTPGTYIVTEKLHGTSGRTGHVEVELEQNRFIRLLNRLPFVRIRPKSEWRVVTGSRKVIIDTKKGEGFRTMVHQMLAPHLVKDEVWYYEIVGYEDTGRPIMDPHTIGKIGDSKLEKRLRRAVGGDTVHYHYGCDPDGALPFTYTPQKPNRFRVYVYRITVSGHDLPFWAMRDRFYDVHSRMDTWERRFFRLVPFLGEKQVQEGFEEEARQQFVEMSREPSRTQAGLPFCEGVCIRGEHGGELDGRTVVHKWIKCKSWVFCALEGIKRNDPDYVDLEEVA